MKKEKQQLTRKQADHLLVSEKLENLSANQMLELFQNNEALQKCMPGLNAVSDPRTQDVVLFNPSRASRPRHKGESSGCPICDGKSTPIIDLEPLSHGISFINQNLYPAVFPHKKTGDAEIQVSGLHFVQWTTSYHDSGWDTMPIEDLAIVFKQLGRLEKYLLYTDFPQDIIGNQRTISIIKNAGAYSGGSMAHDHQQIILTDALPARMKQNQEFEQENGIHFADYLLTKTSPDLVAADLGEAVLLVPPFMRRPYNLILVLRNTSRQFIHQLSNMEINAVVRGWKLAIRSIQQIMPQIGKDISYNVLTHNGPGAGLYFEFLPHSQINGGFEQLGLSICQASPELCAKKYQQVINHL